MADEVWIKIRYDTSEAVRDLQQLEGAGQQSVARQQNSVRSAGSSLGSFVGGVGASVLGSLAASAMAIGRMAYPDAIGSLTKDATARVQAFAADKIGVDNATISGHERALEAFAGIQGSRAAAGQSLIPSDRLRQSIDRLADVYEREEKAKRDVRNEVGGGTAKALGEAARGSNWLRDYARENFALPFFRQ